ncbi:MAG: 16S rRNA (uracil(1498)-N(3))-methyltransferase [Gammaproteobacteria bacterium]|nr:MAG: 16S rRNA (uracil(1498)-N(3))-methyltransferase [Gammaproteobacteria bacterium]
MRTHRFYADIPLSENTSVELPSEAAHHCAQVLRYKVADNLTVFNGDGFDYFSEIESIAKKRCTIKIVSIKNPHNESNLKIHLLQAIARGDKMDFIFQKAVELGVTEITPVFTERCNVKLDNKRLDKKMQHWNKTLISACEQSGRAIIPKLNLPLGINEMQLSEIDSVYLEPTSNKKFTDSSDSQSIRLLIGPEGGLSEKDIKQLDLKGFIGIRVGPRILRTETAGLVAISILQNLKGDL